MTRDTPIEFHRHCPRCHEVKSIIEFPKNRARANGHAAYCKPCASARQKEYYDTPEGRAAVRASQRRSIERAKAAYAEAVAKLSPEDQARLGVV